jgi:surfactin synthase thioesterase subunit
VSPASRSSDEALLGWMRRVGQLPEAVLAEPELRQLALDLFRADKRAAESYGSPPARSSTVHSGTSVVRRIPTSTRRTTRGRA